LAFVPYFVTIIILLSLILFFIIVNSIKVLPTLFPTLSDVFEKHQGLIAIAAIITALLLFKIDKTIDDNNRKNEIKGRLLTVCRILEFELTEFRTVFPDNAILFNDGTNILFLNRFLNLDGYNTILYSGLLSYFGGHTQSLTRRLYERIRIHNKILSARLDHENIFFLYDRSPHRYQMWLSIAATRYNLPLMTIENEIRALIPVLEDLIKIEREKAIV
jgi:hypothetical protein